MTRGLQRFVATVFYAARVGLDLFVDGLGMTVVHRDGGFVVLARDGAKIQLTEDAEAAAHAERPELGLEVADVDALEALHADVPPAPRPAAPETCASPPTAVGSARVRPARRHHRLRGRAGLAVLRPASRSVGRARRGHGPWRSRVGGVARGLLPSAAIDIL